MTTVTLAEQKAMAKAHYDAGRYQDAYQDYWRCLDLCKFRDDVATIYSNMTMCCLKLHMYEQAMHDITQALKRSKNTEIKPEIMIKLRYRLAQSLAHLRDYEQAASILKHLKTYCNTYGDLTSFRICQKLNDKVSELVNHQMKGKYKGSTFAGI